MNGLAPELLSLAHQFRAERNWFGYILLHEKRHRLATFESIETELGNVEYWRLLSDVWVDSENIWQHMPQWMRLFQSGRAERQEFMTAEEQSTFKALPEMFSIYRGYQPRVNRKGLSWTVSRDVAEFMSNRIVPAGTDFKLEGSGGRVRKKTIHKRQAFAYLNRRDEQEIILM